jgi:hypothetical protein
MIPSGPNPSSPGSCAIWLAPNAMSRDMRTIATSVAPTTQYVERRDQSLIHSERTTRPKETGETAAVGPGSARRVAEVVAVIGGTLPASSWRGRRPRSGTRRRPG